MVSAAVGGGQSGDRPPHSTRRQSVLRSRARLLRINGSGSEPTYLPRMSYTSHAWLALCCFSAAAREPAAVAPYASQVGLALCCFFVAASEPVAVVATIAK